MFKQLNKVFKSIALYLSISIFLMQVEEKMAYDSKKIFYYGATGVIAAVMLIALVSSTPTILQYINPQKTGTLLIKLTDAPVNLEELWVNITKLEAHSKEEGWTDLYFTEDQETKSPREWVWVDILTLENVTMDLSITEVPPGNYTKLRMYVNKASANFTGPEDFTGPEEELIPLTVPSGNIDIIIHFEMEIGKTTELLVDMQADWVAINQQHKLRPVLKATVL